MLNAPLKATTFPESNVVFARNQHEYNPLPAWTDGRLVVTCYKFRWRDLLRLIFTRRLWVHQMTFGLPLQPQRLTLDYPFRPMTDAEKAEADPGEPDADRGPDIPETPDPTIDGYFVENENPAPARPRLADTGEEPEPTTPVESREGDAPRASTS